MVRWDRRGFASHRFDPHPLQDHDSFFKLPNMLGEVGCPAKKLLTTIKQPTHRDLPASGGVPRWRVHNFQVPDDSPEANPPC